MAEDRASPDLSGRRILVVEDEWLIADDLQLALERCGAEVIGPVPSCAGALALIMEAAPVDLAALDINLSGEPVFPVADALTKAEIPFVFTTGYGRPTLPDRFKTVRRWEKPFDLEALLRELSELAPRPAAT